MPEGWGARNPGAPTSQHHQRHGCSRRTFAQKKLRIGAHDAESNLSPSRDERRALVKVKLAPALNRSTGMRRKERSCRGSVYLGQGRGQYPCLGRYLTAAEKRAVLSTVDGLLAKARAMKFALPEDGAIVEWIEAGLKEEGPFDAEPISLSLACDLLALAREEALMNAPISVPEGLSIYAELAFSCSNRTVHGIASANIPPTSRAIGA